MFTFTKLKTYKNVIFILDSSLTFVQEMFNNDVNVYEIVWFQRKYIGKRPNPNIPFMKSPLS